MKQRISTKNAIKAELFGIYSCFTLKIANTYSKYHTAKYKKLLRDSPEPGCAAKLWNYLAGIAESIYDGWYMFQLSIKKGAGTLPAPFDISNYSIYGERINR